VTESELEENYITLTIQEVSRWFLSEATHI